MLPGQADFYYPNDQTTRLAWYHDHALGTTRLNAYAGLASGYLILDMRNDELEEHGMIPPLTSTHPLIFQDKIFVGPCTALTDPTWFRSCLLKLRRKAAFGTITSMIRGSSSKRGARLISRRPTRHASRSSLVIPCCAMEQCIRFWR